MKPEAKARQRIDELLQAAGWRVQDRERMNLGAAPGEAVREFPLKTGFADYLLFVDRQAIGAIEAKPEGATLSGVEPQSGKYAIGLGDTPLHWHSPLPFLYESTGIETFFTNTLDPDPRSRRVFAFHKPETLRQWAQDTSTLRARLRQLPPLVGASGESTVQLLWPAQVEAIRGLEASFAANGPRALLFCSGDALHLDRLNAHASEKGLHCNDLFWAMA